MAARYEGCEKTPTRFRACLPAIYGFARSVEHSSQHIPRHSGLHDLCKAWKFSESTTAARLASGRPCWHLHTSPVNSRVVPLLSMPGVPSKTCTTALLPSTSSTCPLREEPSPSFKLTISAYFGFCATHQDPLRLNKVLEYSEGSWQPATLTLTASTITSGPLTPPIVR